MVMVIEEPQMKPGAFSLSEIDNVLLQYCYKADSSLKDDYNICLQDNYKIYIYVYQKMLSWY